MESIVTYFEGEKVQCIAGVVFAISCISLSVYFLYLQSAMLKGIAYTFIPLALFLMAVCVTVIFRTPGDIERITEYYQTETVKMQTEELPRMESVMKSFSIIKKVEIVVILAGILLLAFYWNGEVMKGVAIGLIIQGTLLYLFDHIAEGRGEVYMDFLKTLG